MIVFLIVCILRVDRVHFALGRRLGKERREKELRKTVKRALKQMKMLSKRTKLLSVPVNAVARNRNGNW